MAIDLWSDCDGVPFRFGVHVKQHNERLLGLSMGMPRKVRFPIKDVQQSLRFGPACRADKPETYLAACSSGFDRITGGAYGDRAFWLPAMQALDGVVLRYNVDTETFSAEPMLQVYSVTV